MTVTVTGTVALVYLAAAAALAAAWRALVLWRAARDELERYRRRHSLVSRAALELQQLRSPEDVFEALPELMVQVLACRSARVLVPDGEELRTAASAGESEFAPGATRGDVQAEAELQASRMTHALAMQAIRERRLIQTDAVPEPASGAVPAGRTGTFSALARPLFVGDRLVAVLKTRRNGPSAFDRGDAEAIEAVGRLTEEALLRLAATDALRRRERESGALARVSENLLLAPDQGTAADAALRYVLELLDASSGAVLHIAGDRLVPIARAGTESERQSEILDRGVPFEDGPFRDAWRYGRTVFAVEDGAPSLDGVRELVAGNGAIVPVIDAGGETRAVLVLAADRQERLDTPSRRSLLDTIATSLGATLQRLQLQHLLRELLEVVRGLAQSDEPEELYSMAVAAAVRLIPGAEAATLLVHRDGEFHFASGDGFDMGILATQTAFDQEQQLTWYGLGRSAFLRGVPRVMRGSEIRERSAAATRDHPRIDPLVTAGRVRELRSTLCVPIVAGSEILGILNIDNLSLEEAFGDAELELAASFGQQIGVIIRQTQTREALARAAVTDPVTGLGNREGFNRRLELDLARARRRDERVHLVMMDLDGFKRINDELGHPAGDVALQRVARALEEGLRAEDGLFRWGGDEFALLISGVGDREVRVAAERHAAAVARVDVGGRRMSMSVGIASFPRDGVDAPTLLRRADDLMYQRKYAGQEAGGADA